MKTLSKHNRTQIAAKEKRKKAILRMRKSGKSWTEIGATMGISRQRVMQIMKDRKP